MAEVNFCPLCLSKYVGKVCTSCGGKGIVKPVAKAEVKEKESKGK